MKIKLTLETQDTIIFNMDNNKTTQSFLEQLPLSLDFEDYSRTEKISYLPKKLSTLGAPNGYEPKVGDFCLYAPWGNLCIFYKNFSYAAGLIKLGKVIEGKENLKYIEGQVKIEVIE